MAVWKFSPGKGANFWHQCLSNGHIAMGWEEVNDLTWVKDFETLSEICRKKDYSYGGVRTADIQLWEFNKIQVNDVVISYGRGKILGIGIVVSPYYYDNSWKNRVSDYYGYPHRYKINWIYSPNLSIKKDKTLYGNPPSSYGTLNTEDTIHKIADEYTIERIKQLVIDALFG